MFEALTERAEMLARRRADEVRAQLAARLRAEGIAVDMDEGGVVLRGRGLRARLALEPALRWLTTELRR